MRAWQVVRAGEPRAALALAEVERPEPGERLIRVRVAGAALGLPDVFMCRGSYALTPRLPYTPGQELVGEVTAVGPGVEARIGERVMGVSAFFLRHGAFAEEALALGDFFFPAPDTVPDAQAAGFVIQYHTAWVGLVRRAQLQSGETLLVLGAAGGSGSAAVQLGCALGARVIATAGGPEKVAFCRELGADTVIDYRAGDIAEAVLEATQGRGAEVIFDPVGGDAFQAATRCITHEGRLCMVGFGSGQWGQPSAPHITTRNYSVLGVIPSAYDRAFKDDVQRTLMDLYRSGAIRVAVHAEHPFEELPRALEELAGGRVCGRSVLRVA